MSDKTKRGIELAATVIVAVASIAGIAGAWVVLPYRVGAVEKRVEEVNTKVDAKAALAQQDHELLVRIDERLKDLQARQKRGE
jgi:hypothetical protein